MVGPSLRPQYLIAIAAYLVGYPLLIHLAANLGTFDALWPERTLFELADIPTPRGLTLEQAFAYATCVSSAQCELMVAAYVFVPLAIVSSAVRGLVAQAGGVGPARPQPAFLFCLLSCLVLVPVSHVLLLGPLVGVDGLFTYADRWTHLPMVNLIQHAGFAIAAWFAAHHCVRAYAPAPSVALLDAVRSGDADALVELLGAGADPNVTGDDGALPLHVAAASGNAEVVQTLLAGEANPNLTDAAGAAPLHIAAERGDTSAIVALVAEGGDVDARDAAGATALHRAVSGQHGNAVVYLLEFGADPALMDNAGRSALGLWSGPRDEVFEQLSAASGAQAVES